MGKECKEKVISVLNDYLRSNLKNPHRKDTTNLFALFRSGTHISGAYSGFSKWFIWAGYTVSYDVQHYNTHSDVALYFPLYLNKTLKNLTKWFLVLLLR